MKAYVIVTAQPGQLRDLAKEISNLPGVLMADACWGVGDIYSVLEFTDWKTLNSVVLEKIRRMPGVMRTDTHVAIMD